MAASPAVDRLLRVCDPDGTLPVTTQRDERLLAPRFDEGQNRRPLLQLVPQPR